MRTPRNNTMPQQEQISFSNAPTSFSRPTAWAHTFYLTGVIEDAQKYSEWFEIIRTAGPDDDITIHINSPGGSYTTALQFRRVISETMANVTCSIEGECHSAASVIFLGGDSFSVSEGSSMLVHDYSSIAAGKGSELHRQIVFEKSSIDRYLRSAYQYFLSDDEINDIVGGKDMWLDDEEIVARVQKMVELREEEIEEYLAQQEEELQEPDDILEDNQPKKTRKKK